MLAIEGLGEIENLKKRVISGLSFSSGLDIQVRMTIGECCRVNRSQTQKLKSTPLFTNILRAKWVAARAEISDVRTETFVTICSQPPNLTRVPYPLLLSLDLLRHSLSIPVLESGASCDTGEQFEGI